MHTRRVLWITDEVPDSALGGGSIRQYHLLKRTAERATVDLLLAGHLRPDSSKEAFSLRESLGRVIEVGRPKHRTPRYGWLRSRLALLPGLAPSEVALAGPTVRALRAALPVGAGYDVVHVEHEGLAPILPRVRAESWVLTLHNLLSTRLAQNADLASTGRVSWLLRRDASHAERLESRLLRDYDRVITVSEEDASRLGGRACVVPNGVDIEQFTVTDLPEEPRLIFTASWNWEPNAEAAVWFCREVLPRIQSRLPDATLILVGREPPPSVRDLGSLPAVETHFDVPTVAPYLAKGRVAVVPLRVGSGTRLKALEAMAGGRPVVGTSIGLEGLGLVDGHTAGIADSVEGLSQWIVELCLDDRRAQAMAAAARRLVATRFSWDVIARSYWDVLEEVCERR